MNFNNLENWWKMGCTPFSVLSPNFTSTPKFTYHIMQNFKVPKQNLSHTFKAYNKNFSDLWQEHPEALPVHMGKHSYLSVKNRKLLSLSSEFDRQLLWFHRLEGHIQIKTVLKTMGNLIYWLLLAPAQSVSCRYC